MDSTSAFASLNRMTGLAPLRVPQFSGTDSYLPTPFRVATAAAAALGLTGSTADGIWRLRQGGAAQTLSLDLRAASASLVSFALMRLNGEPVPRPAETNPTVGFYRAGDGRWVHLHGGFPHLARGTLKLLAAEDDARSIAEAVGKWNALALEEALAHLGLCGTVARSEPEWLGTPQGKVLAEAAPLVLTRIGEAPRLELGPGEAPLSGVRVLDLTRVLAGPTAGRTLASHGAEVLHVRAERLPSIGVFDLDTGHGKRSAFLDLAKPADAERLRKLVRKAHVFVDSYRPGALAKLGFTSESLSHLSPGIVHVGISCYGRRGPWAARPGWEQLAQTATGIACEQGVAMAAREKKRKEPSPRLIPAAACDVITGYLAAAGAAAALLRQMREGGSWCVEVSLCATAMWLQSLGRVPAVEMAENWNPAQGLDGYMQACDTARGRLDFLGPVMRMSETQPAWRRPPPEPGADEAGWFA